MINRPSSEYVGNLERIAIRTVCYCEQVDYPLQVLASDGLVKREGIRLRQLATIAPLMVYFTCLPSTLYDGERSQPMQLRATPPSSYLLLRQTLEQIEQEFGTDTVPQIFKLLESQPALLTHLWGQFHTLVLQGDLPRVLKEMVGLVVATATHCDHLCVVLLQSLTQQHAEQQTLTAIVEGNYESARVSHATLSVLRFAALAMDNRTAGGTLAKSKWQLLQHQSRQALDDTGLEEGEQLELVATLALFEQLCLVANLLQLDPA